MNHAPESTTSTRPAAAVPPPWETSDTVRPTTPSHWLRWAVLIAVGLTIAGVLAWRLGGREPAPSAAGAGRRVLPPAPVLTEPVRTGDMPVYLDGIGSVTPLTTVTVKSRVDGQLMSVLFREGQMVHAGDLLAEIDPRPFQVQLEQAQGQMTRDQALLANARVDLERYRGLIAKDAIPKQQLDTQDALVHQYEGLVQSDQAQIDNAKLQLVYSRITAPLSGRLGLRLVDAGNMVHANDAGGLVVITQIQPIAVVFTLPEDSVPRIMARMKTGEPLTVEAYDRDRRHKLATGTLLTVDNAIDPNTGTLRLKAEFPNDDGALFANQFVNARLMLDVHRGVTLVPTVAIQRGRQGPFVYAVKDDHTAEVRPVQVGLTEGDTTSIDNGVSPGEMVVVDGADGLSAGRPVLVQNHDSKSPTPAGK